MFSFRNGFYFQISCSGFNFVPDFSAWGGNLRGRGRGAWSRVQIAGFLLPWFFTLNFTGANRGFLPPSAFRIVPHAALHIVSHGCKSWVLPPSLDLRVRIRPFCPRRLSCMLSRTAARAAQLRVLRKRNSSGKASSDAGPELAGRESCVAMESPQALMSPLEKGVRGIEISGLCRCSGSPS